MTCSVCKQARKANEFLAALVCIYCYFAGTLVRIKPVATEVLQ